MENGFRTKSRRARNSASGCSNSASMGFTITVHLAISTNRMFHNGFTALSTKCHMINLLFHVRDNEKQSINIKVVIFQNV